MHNIEISRIATKTIENRHEQKLRKNSNPWQIKRCEKQIYFTAGKASGRKQEARRVNKNVGRIDKKTPWKRRKKREQQRQ